MFEDAIEVTGDEGEIILSKKEDIFEGLSIAPNPVKSTVNINGDIRTHSTIRLIDQTGKTIAVKNFDSIEKGDVLFDVDQLYPGLYNVVISTSEGVKNFKIIKQ